MLFVASALRSGHEILLFLRFERTFRWFINRLGMAWFRQEANGYAVIFAGRAGTSWRPERWLLLSQAVD
jgi:hypothetical protein